MRTNISKTAAEFVVPRRVADDYAHAIGIARGAQADDFFGVAAGMAIGVMMWILLGFVVPLLV